MLIIFNSAMSFSSSTASREKDQDSHTRRPARNNDQTPRIRMIGPEGSCQPTEEISQAKPQAADQLDDFYQLCLKYS